MKVSWRWLLEMADLAGVDPEEVVRLLPLRVADVEGVERLGALDGVVTARVLEVEPHPGADRLRLCTVDHGSSTVQRVVCGAPNVAKGQVVCFARIGTTLPNGVTLKKAKIRGVDSEGMICAEDELGIGTDHAGIIVLPEGTPVGRPAAEALGVSDLVIDLNNSGLTSRPDLWGHAGVAREVSAVVGRALRLPAAEKAAAAVAAAPGSPFPVTIEAPDACRRYLALVLEGVVNGPSPAPLRRRLESLGLRSVDLLVDLTNLVMLEQGQPLHAFDLREVRGGRIVVRRARAGGRSTAPRSTSTPRTS
jgi:phenylalanyl-tRNA synthetase beta chain